MTLGHQGEIKRVLPSTTPASHVALTIPPVTPLPPSPHFSLLRFSQGARLWQKQLLRSRCHDPSQNEEKGAEVPGSRFSGSSCPFPIPSLGWNKGGQLAASASCVCPVSLQRCGSEITRGQGEKRSGASPAPFLNPEGFLQTLATGLECRTWSRRRKMTRLKWILHIASSPLVWFSGPGPCTLGPCSSPVPCIPSLGFHIPRGTWPQC